MRERVEDLGVLAERLRQLMDNEIYSAVRVRDETFCETYKNEDKLEELYYQIQYLTDELAECWQIARFGDDDEGVS